MSSKLADMEEKNQRVYNWVKQQQQQQQHLYFLH